MREVSRPQLISKKLTVSIKNHGRAIIEIEQDYLGIKLKNSETASTIAK
jgi:hypothetical protein